jgi:hypothetical protein
MRCLLCATGAASAALTGGFAGQRLEPTKKPRVEAGLHESLRGSEPAAGKESWAAIAWLVIEQI